MPDHSYEIEIKSLLGDKAKADDLVSKMKAAYPGLLELGSHKQLNHYFVPAEQAGNPLGQLCAKLKGKIDQKKWSTLADLAEKAKDYSVRTRWADGKVLLVVKASVDDTTSSNGTARLEWETQTDFSIEMLDNLILESDFKYQAKWSRERSEYKYKGANVSIDKNAGYGYLSEFEMVIDDQDKAEQTKSLLRQMMHELGIAELPQDRLARMFDFYNKNWPDYYGTDNIFTIE